MHEHEITDQVVVLTGGTSGIGRIGANELAARGATVGVIGRDQTRGETLCEDAGTHAGEIDFYQTDLATQTAVRALATDLRNAYSRIDALGHNAGLSARRYTETDDGIERTFAVNHCAPYLLTHELMDRLRDTAPTRIVVTASAIHRRATLDFDALERSGDLVGVDPEWPH